MPEPLLSESYRFFVEPAPTALSIENPPRPTEPPVISNVKEAKH